MPRPQGEGTQIRVRPEDLKILKEIKTQIKTQNKHIWLWQAVHHALQERDPQYIKELKGTIEKLKTDIGDVRKSMRTQYQILQDERNRNDAFVKANSNLEHIIEEKDKNHVALNEFAEHLHRQNQELRLKLKLQPLGTDLPDALQRFTEQSQREDLIPKVDSIREGIADVHTQLSIDFNRIAQQQLLLDSTTIEALYNRLTSALVGLVDAADSIHGIKESLQGPSGNPA